MKIIELNENNLLDEEVDRKVFKTRGLVFNNRGEVLICNYAGVYLLPGGSIDQGETIEQAFIRELKEETGIDINCNEIMKFLTIKDYNRNYYDRKLKLEINRLTVTHFFITKTSSLISTSNDSLTESELKNNFYVQFIKLDSIPQIVKKNDPNNIKSKVFERELLTVLSEYELFIKKI